MINLQSNQFSPNSPRIIEIDNIYIFNLMNYLQNGNLRSSLVVISSLLIQFLQMLSYSFSPLFIKSWRDTQGYTTLSFLLESFRIIPLNVSNTISYLIVFYGSVLFMIFYTTILIYSSISLTKNHFIILWPLRLIRLFTSVVTGVLFIPLLSKSLILLLIQWSIGIFFSPFNCSSEDSDSVHYYTNNIQCFTGLLIAPTIFGCLCSIVIIIIKAQYVLLAYDIKLNTSNFLSKFSSCNDILFLIEQVLFSLTRELLRSEDINIIIYLSFSLALAVRSYQHNPYFNRIAKQIHLLQHMILLWSMISLFSGRLLIGITQYNPLLMFIAGCPVIILLSFFFEDNPLKIFYAYEANCSDSLYKILLYIHLIENQHTRDNEIILEAYIRMTESECYYNDCALKRYLSTQKTTQGNGLLIYLFLHADHLFTSTIEKYPTNTLLHLCYSYFLYHKLRKKNYAMVQLTNAKSNIDKSYHDTYFIYQLENEYDPSSKSQSMAEISDALMYKIHFQRFKALIIQASFSYKEFWTILHTNHQNASTTITKLNNVGYSISRDIEQIRGYFEKMQRIHNEDKTALQYYADFIEVIMNNEGEARKYHEKIGDLEKLSKSIDNEDIIDIDPCYLDKNDSIQYIIVSMNNEDQPIMQNISLGLCESLGYNRQELEGKHLDLIIPEIYRRHHSKLLQKRMTEFNGKMYESRIDKLQYNTISSFSQSKLRFIIPIRISPGIVPNEYDEHYFIARITIGEEFLNNQCYVITDMNNIITTYTPTAMGMLELSSNDMKNHGMSIYDYITEIPSSCGAGNANPMENCGNSNNLSIVPKSKKSMKHMKSMKSMKSMKVTYDKYYERNILWEKKERINDNSVRTSFHSAHKGLAGLSVNLISNPKAMVLDCKRIMMDNEQIGSLFKFKMVKSSRIRSNKNDYNQSMRSINKGNDISMSIISESSIGMEDPNYFDQNFLPNNNDEFIFLVNNGEYCITQKGEQQTLINLMEKAKNEAIDDIRKQYQSQQQSSTITSNSHSNSQSDYYETSSSNGSEYYSSEAALSIGQNKPHLNNKRNSNHVTHNKRNTLGDINANDDYYHVKLSKAQYSIYNYDNKGYDTQSAKPFQSKVEEIMKNYSNSNQLDKDNSITGHRGRTLTTEEEKRLYMKELQKKSKARNDMLVKKLTFALAKYETHHEITLLKIISAIVVLIGIAESIGFYLYYQNAAVRLVTNMSLIYDSYELLLDIIVSVYLVREISLISNENYTMTYASIFEYRKQVVSDINDYFNKGEVLINSIIATSAFFTYDNYMKLYFGTFKTYSIKDDLGLHNINMTLQVALSSAMDSLYHITLTTKEELLPSNDSVYSFVVNGLNGINEALKMQSNIFIEELKITMDNIKKESLTLCIVYAVMSIPCYLLLSRTYFKVSAKKDDYMNIFFEIDDQIIVGSLRICDEFCHRLVKKNKNKHEDKRMSTAMDDYSQDDYDGDDKDDDDDDDYDCNMNDLLIASFDKSSNNNKQSLNNPRKDCYSLEGIVIRTFIMLLLSLIIIFTAAIVYQSNQALDAIYFSILVFRSETLLQSRYLTVFNIFREYVFDKSIDVLYEPLDSVIESIFSTIYTMRSEEIIIVKQYERYCPPDYIALTHYLDRTNICALEEQLFPSFISDAFSCSQVTYGSGELGLPILLSFYIEEIKTMKNAFYISEAIAEKNDFKYNSTLIGLPQYAGLYPNTTDEEVLKLYAALHPINFLNKEKHDQIVLLFRYIILPLMIKKNSAMENGFRASDAQFELVYSLLLLVDALIITLAYLLIWRRIENNLNEAIYKSKNMLRIIPMKVLIRLNSIHKLFELNSKGENNNNIVY